MTEERRGLPRAPALPGRTLGEKLWAFARSPLRGKIRRWYLSVFRKRYVREQLNRRRGSCRQCGACCRLAYRCVFLDGHNRCKIYDRARHPNCVTFPIDRRDLEDVNGVCGFHFDDGEPVSAARQGEDARA